MRNPSAQPEPHPPWGHPGAPRAPRACSTRPWAVAAAVAAVPAPALALSLLLCGCQVLSYRGPAGERLTRASLGSTTSISSLAVELGTNGARRIELRGYQNDTAQAMGTVTEAAVRAALSSAKP